MKNNFLLLLTIAFYSNIYCQGNLQFNRVINLEYSNGVTIGGSLTIYDTLKVPLNKVWKVESAGAIRNSLATPSFDYAIYLNNYLLYNPYSPNNTSLLDPVNYPIWLSSGNYVLKCLYGSNTPKVSVSIIEFNIVP